MAKWSNGQFLCLLWRIQHGVYALHRKVLCARERLTLCGAKALYVFLVGKTAGEPNGTNRGGAQRAGDKPLSGGGKPLSGDNRSQGLTAFRYRSQGIAAM